MTLKEARALFGGKVKFTGKGGIKRKVVNVKRSGAEWTGELVGIVERPALVLEVDGQKVPIVLDGAEVVVVSEAPAKEGK